MNDTKDAESREKGMKLDDDEFIGTKTLSQDTGINHLPRIQEDYVNMLLQ